MAEFDANNLRNRASLLAQLQQQGFTQANQLAQNAFQQQGNLAAQQMGLSNFQRGSIGQDVSALGNLGAFRQGLTQHNYKQMLQLIELLLMNHMGRLDQYGAGLGRLAGFGSAPAAPMGGGSDPLTAAISNAVGLAGIFGKLYGSRIMRPLNRPMFRNRWPYQRKDHVRYERTTISLTRMLLVGEHPKEFKDASG